MCCRFKTTVFFIYYLLLYVLQSSSLLNGAFLYIAIYWWAFTIEHCRQQCALHVVVSCISFVERDQAFVSGCSQAYALKNVNTDSQNISSELCWALTGKRWRNCVYDRILQLCFVSQFRVWSLRYSAMSNRRMGFPCINEFVQLCLIFLFIIVSRLANMKWRNEYFCAIALADCRTECSCKYWSI